ncbi:MAG: hypothetical protein EKK64_04840 [Neisseriaceae bacterium]|nr:MAG: hypothetical protein EKK64_04840 [Neisseriaceae bacterium]
MNTFKNWLYLNEGMSVSVVGHSEEDVIRDLDSICNNIREKLVVPLWNKLPEESKKQIQKAGGLSSGTIVPDGSYYETGEQVINLYTNGWPEEFVPKLLSGLKYYLDSLKIKYGPFKQEQSGLFGGDVVRVPVLSFDKTKNVPTPLHLNNLNAKLIFSDILGFAGDESGYGEIPPEELLFKIDSYEREKLAIHARDAFGQKTKNGPQYFQGGIDIEGIESRLQTIRSIAKWAIDNHYSGISVS